MWGFDLFERVRFELLGKGQSLVEDMSVSQQAAVYWNFQQVVRVFFDHVGTTPNIDMA